MADKASIQLYLNRDENGQIQLLRKTDDNNQCEQFFIGHGQIFFDACFIQHVNSHGLFVKLDAYDLDPNGVNGEPDDDEVIEKPKPECKEHMFGNIAAVYNGEERVALYGLETNEEFKKFRFEIKPTDDVHKVSARLIKLEEEFCDSEILLSCVVDRAWFNDLQSKIERESIQSLSIFTRLCAVYNSKYSSRLMWLFDKNVIDVGDHANVNLPESYVNEFQIITEQRLDFEGQKAGYNVFDVDANKTDQFMFQVKKDEELFQLDAMKDIENGFESLKQELTTARERVYRILEWIFGAIIVLIIVILAT